MNEDTIFQSQQLANDAEFSQPVEQNQKDAWKQVSLGGTVGILMGAGAMYASGLSANDFGKSDGEDIEGAAATHDVSVASVSHGLSFGEAFAAARAEVGPGGVFYWHGGIYNTYTAEEWNSMSVEQKNDFAQAVRPEIPPQRIQVPTDHHPDVVVHHVNNTEDVSVVGSDTTDTTDAPNDDVHIVGYGNVHGHLAVGVDITGDHEADIAIIDVDDNRVLSDPDIIVDKDGNAATFGEIIHEDSNYDTYTDNPSTPDVDTTDSDMLLYDC